MSKLATMLRRQRARKGHSLRELADLTGLSASYLSDAENDRRTFSPNALRAVCRVLGIDYQAAVKHLLKDIERRYVERYMEDA